MPTNMNYFNKNPNQIRFKIYSHLILISLCTACENLFDSADIIDGVNFRFYQNSQHFEHMFYRKNGKLVGNYYTFYNNGILYSNELVSDSNKFSYIYNNKGELVCYRYFLQKVNSNSDGEKYKYITVDSCYSLFSEPGKLTIQNEKTINSSYRVYSELSVHPANYLISQKRDSICLGGIDENGNFLHIKSIKINE